MTVKECANFDREFPETFPWGHVDSITLTNLASDLCSAIDHDFRNGDRNLVPGLRFALNKIAEYAKV